MRCLILLLLFSVTITTDAGQYPAFVGLKEYETQNFIFVYPEELREFTNKLARDLEEAHAKLAPVFLGPEMNGKTSGKVPVLVTDHIDSFNAFAYSGRQVKLVFRAISPTSERDNDWMNTTALHEYAHTVSLDQTSGWSWLYRMLLGNTLKPNPNFLPTWFKEGLAVWAETAYSDATRGYGTFWEGLLRTYVAENRDFPALDELDERPVYPYGTSPYLWGFYVVDQAEKEFERGGRGRDGGKALAEFSDRNTHRVPFFISGNINNLVGKDWGDLYDAFERETRARMKTQIAGLKKSGLTQFEPIDDIEVSSVTSFGIAPNGTLLISRSSKSDYSGLYRYKDGDLDEISHRVVNGQMSFSADSTYVYFASREYDDPDRLRRDLFRTEIESGDTDQLTEGLSIGDPDVIGDQIVFTVASGGRTQVAVAKLSAPEKYTVLFESGIGEPIEDTRFTPDRGGVLFLHKKRLMRVGVANKKSAVLVSRQGFLNHLAPASKGKYVLVSDKNGVDNAYLFDLRTRKLSPLTNVIGGVALPQVHDNSLYAAVLNSHGYQISKTPIKTRKAAPKVAPKRKFTKYKKNVNVRVEKTAETGHGRSSGLGPHSWNALPELSLSPTVEFDLSRIQLRMKGWDWTETHGYWSRVGYHLRAKEAELRVGYWTEILGPQLTVWGGDRVYRETEQDDGSYAIYRNTTFGFSISESIPWVNSFTLTPGISIVYSKSRAWAQTDTAKSDITHFDANPYITTDLLYNSTRSSNGSYFTERGSYWYTGADTYLEGGTEVVAYSQYRKYFRTFWHQVFAPRVRAAWASHNGTLTWKQINYYGSFRYHLYDADFSSTPGFSGVGIPGYRGLNGYTRLSVDLDLLYRIPLFRLNRGMTSGLFFVRKFWLDTNFKYFYIQNVNPYPVAGGAFKFTFHFFQIMEGIFAAGYDYGLREDPDRATDGEAYVSVGIDLPTLW